MIKQIINRDKFVGFKASKSQNDLSKRNNALLLIVVVLNLLTLLGELKPWLFALLGLCFIWRVCMIYLPPFTFHKWILIAFALTGSLILAINAKQLGLLLTMVHLLSFAYGLKMLELNSRKDIYQLFLIGLFILASSLIFTQSLGYFIMFFIIFISNLSLLYGINSEKRPLKNSVIQCGKLIIQSIPLAVALFVVFPKLSPFWQVPFAKSAKTGLSDRVSVGDVANLALSNEIAFRVDFNNDPPSYNQLYWRTLVLDNFDGNSWFQTNDKRRGNQQKNGKQQKFDEETQVLKGQSTNYQIIAQPSYQHWLFALDVATVNQSNISKKQDFTLSSLKPITQSMSYQVKSFLQGTMNEGFEEPDKAQYLLLPENINPRLTDLGMSLRASYLNDVELIQQVLKQFNQQNYRYTLQPPSLGDNALDQFYFDTKSGFCEHYASSFAFLMRSAGIPARLVVGYMGAEYNSQGDFYIVRQRDAHAWVEVWLDTRGWTRVDPTASVNPERVENGFTDELFQERSFLSGDLLSYQQLISLKWLTMLQQQIANMDYHWTKWVIGYNTQQQLSVLKKFFGDYRVWKVAAIIAVILMLTMMILFLVNREKKLKSYLSPWLNLYINLIIILDKKGIAKEKSMSANQFLMLVKKQAPEIYQSFLAFNETFTDLNYKSLTNQEIKEKHQLIKSQYKRCKLVFKRHL